MREEELKNHSSTVVVQKHQINNSDRKISEVYSKLSEIEKKQDDIVANSQLFLDELENDLAPFDISDEEYNESMLEIEIELALMSNEHSVSSIEKLDIVSFDEDMPWDEYLTEVKKYADRNDINLDLEFEKMFAFENIELIQLKPGIEPSIICIDGFLTENENGQRWLDNMPEDLKQHSIYYLKWESQNFLNMAKEIFKPELEKLLTKTFLPLVLKDIIKIWSKATTNAEKAGKSIAGLIHNQDKDFILIGHSLGSRVIRSCLENLSLSNKCNIIDVYLLGGAVKNDYDSWIKESAIIQGNMYNFTSEKDRVLQVLYKIGESSSLKFDKPIGRHFINIDKIKNFNVSDLIDGHMVYHENLSNIFKKKDSNDSSSII